MDRRIFLDFWFATIFVIIISCLEKGNDYYTYIVSQINQYSSRNFLLHY